jgi:hypothetical protein
MMRHTLCSSFLLVFCFLIPAESRALDVTKLRASPHAHDVLSLRFLDFPVTVAPTGGIFTHYEQGPLVFQGASGPDHLVRTRVTTALYGSVSFAQRYSLGFYFPMAVVNNGDPGTPKSIEGGFALGDLGISAKAALLHRPVHKDGVGLGLALDARLATGVANEFMSDGNMVLLPSLIADYKIKGYRFALNLGYLVRTDDAIGQLQIDDEFDIRVGADIPLMADTLSMFGVFGSTTRVAAIYSDANTTYMEFDYGLRFNHDSGFMVMAGGGGGLAHGYGNVKMRVFAGVGYHAPLSPPDGDEDGVPDEDDRCPVKPEDHDNYEDSDGCPEPDNDFDGILDEVDKCPLDKEDRDGFEDEDGCPEYDNDNDGLSDGNDMCPDESEDFDGVEDDDGCPD